MELEPKTEPKTEPLKSYKPYNYINSSNSSNNIGIKVKRVIIA